MEYVASSASSLTSPLIIFPDNDFLTLDLTKSWQIASPALKQLPQPSGPPPVSNGFLWSSFQSLFLYGGEFSSEPTTSPVPFALWEYNIGSSSWQEHSDPTTSGGANSGPAGEPVQRAAEGAGVSVAGLGRGWYFGGHLDPYTTAGWAQSVPRIYTKSLLQYTFPGSGNAPADGTWTNITGGGSQSSAGFPERADGVLVYVPGFGDQGILVGLAGGTADTFTELNVIDVFDIATSMWYKQSTAGPTPKIRVNPCAVVAAAADGSSYNIYMYGGQNLQPAGNQVQYSDIWILTLPAFTWIPIDTSKQSSPPARAGHSCNVWDGQMVVVGGYVGQALSCDSPGVYVFDLSSASWAQQFTQMSQASANPLSLQQAQIGNPLGPNAALQGSNTYEVPEIVRSVVGGEASGGATVTKPVATATSGPLASGAPKTYHVPGDRTGGGSKGGNGGGSNSGGGGSSSTATIVGAVVGSVAGVFLILGLYAVYCAWLWKRRLRMYQGFMEADRRQKEQKDGLMAQEKRGRKLPPRGASGMSSNGDLLAGQEPTFVGIMLHPRRSLRVVNPDR